jgi:hypothetical protein
MDDEGRILLMQYMKKNSSNGVSFKTWKYTKDIVDYMKERKNQELY